MNSDYPNFFSETFGAVLDLDTYRYKTCKFPKQKYDDFEPGKIVFNYYVLYLLC